jgi:hypothetical protein
MSLTHSLVTVVVVALPMAASAGQLSKQKVAAQPTQLLAGRLTARLPASARLEARRRSIMAAPESGQDESRVVLEAGREKLVIMVYELFALAGDDLEASVKKTVKQQKGGELTVQKLAARGLQTVAVTLAKPDVTAEAVLILSQYTALSDRTVQLLNFYVNPEAAKDVAGCRSLAKRIAATVAAGKAPLMSKAGVRALKGLDGSELKITVPDGWVATTQPGPDFVVHRLRKLTLLSENTEGIGVYLGGHPSYQHRQRGLDAKSVKQSPGTLLGKKVVWQEWSLSPKDSSRTAEAIVPISARIQAHVFITTEAVRVQELKKIASTLKR